MTEVVRDANGTELRCGDSVTLIKDLKVKGTSETIKRGTLACNHPPHRRSRRDRLQRPAQVKGLVLKTEFLKKA
jgi:protein PhnA